MNLYDVFNSSGAVKLGVTLSSMTPTWLGLPIGYRVADLVAMQKQSRMVKAVRVNQWVLSGERLSGAALDAQVRKVFRSIAHSLYEFYHFLDHPEKLIRCVDFDDRFEAFMQRRKAEGRGSLLVVPHLSNFDLIGCAMIARGLPLHALTHPQSWGGYEWQNILRVRGGYAVSPMTFQGLKEANQTLREGGVLVTGVDRPLPQPEAKYRPRFLGRAASMPVFHIRMALKHHLPITVLGACRKPDGRYCVWASDPLEMQPRPDLVEETVLNAERVLEEIGKNLRVAPEQWAMIYPVWQEAMG